MSAVDLRSDQGRRAPDRPAATMRFAASRLVPAAVALWGLMAGSGLLLTHPLADTSFEKWDGSVDRWFARHRGDPWTTLTHYVSSMVETLPVIVIGAVFFVALRIGLRRWRESLFLAVALIGEVSIFVCTTLVIDRARPAVAHLDAAPPTSSFPSGHTAASVALYGALAVITWCCTQRGWLRAVATLLAVVVPVAVALSRLYRGMHFPTDVLAGALLALLWLTITARVVLTGRR